MASSPKYVSPRSQGPSKKKPSSKTVGSKSAAPPRTVNLIMVGGSQNGKSTLGNFLFYGKCWRKEKRVFDIGTGTSSCTMHVDTVDAEWIRTFQKPNKMGSELPPVTKEERVIVRIWDTPGTGDSSGDDSSNMLRLFRKLVEAGERDGELHGLLFVMKFQSLITPEYEANVRFYQKIFPELFQNNAVLVFTNASGTKLWFEDMDEQLSRPGGCHGIMNDVQTKLQKITDLKTIPYVYLDGNPPAHDADGLKQAQDVRNFLFSRASQFSGSALRRCTFPKLPRWIQEDAQEVGRLEAENDGVNKGLELTEKEVGRLGAQITQLSAQRSNFVTQRDAAETERSQKDTTDNYKIWEQSFSDEWHVFSRANQGVDVKTLQDIKSKAVTDGWLELDVDEPRHIKGKIKATLWTSMAASLALYTSHQLYYEERIKELRATIAQKDADIQQCEKDIQLITSHNAETTTKLEQLKSILEQNNSRAAALRRTDLEWPELEARVKRTQDKQ